MIFYFFFISLYSLDTSFTEKYTSWLICEIHESIKTLETRNSIVFDLSFPNNTNLSCFFFFFFRYDLYFF